MARRLAPIFGLEKFGVSEAGLRRLGSKLVTIEIDLPIPPYVYPSRAALRRLLRMTPAERRALVHAWRTRKCLALRNELTEGTVTVKRFNRDPIGVFVTLPAQSIDRFRRLRHAHGAIWLRAIAGRRVRKSSPDGPRLFAVAGRMVRQFEGQTRGFQLCENRITAVMARSEREASARVARIMAKEHDPFLSISGEFMRWHFEGVTDVCECPDETFAASGTEIFYDYKNRRVRSEHEWHPGTSKRVRRQARD